MNFLPCATKLSHLRIQCSLNARKFHTRKPVIFPENHGSREAGQLENSFTALPNHMNMWWPMIVRVNDNPKSTKPQYGWHE